MIRWFLSVFSLLIALTITGGAAAQRHGQVAAAHTMFDGWCPSLAWQPGGDRLLCWRRDDSPGIVALREGEEPTLVLATTSSHFSWNAGGSQVAALEQAEHRDTSLVMIGADGNGRRVLVADVPQPGRISWRPDGSEIWVGRGHNVVAVPASGGAEHVVTAGSSPSWSPDGRMVAFLREDPGHGTEVWTFTAASSEIAQRGRFEGRGAVVGPLRWSPDSRWLAVTGSRPGEYQAHLSVWDTRAPNGGFRQVAGDVTGDDIAWSPNSREIAASVYGRGPRGEGVRHGTLNRFSLVAISVESRRRRVLATPDRGPCRVWLPAWSDRGLAFVQQCVAPQAGAQVRTLLPRLR